MFLADISNNDSKDLTGSSHWPLLYRFVQTRCINHTRATRMCSNRIFLHLPEYGYRLTRRFQQHRRVCRPG